MSQNEDNKEFDELIEKAVNSETPVKWVTTKPSDLRKAIKRTRQMAFLKAFAEAGNLTEACKLSKVNYETQRRWSSGDPWFAAQFKDALQAFRDGIEKNVQEWAMQGIDEPIVGKVAIAPGMMEDKIIGWKKSRNALLTMFHAKRHIPEYRDKYEPPKDEKGPETQSPMARITLRLDMIAARQQNALPEQETVIDITPEQPQLPEGNPE